MHRPTQGFTLIELLIVIAIIGILTAILVPNLLGARNRAYDAAAQSCAKELITQGEIYAIDNQDQGYTGYDGTGAYAPRSCAGGSVMGFAVSTATVNELAGTVTSKSSSVFEFDRTTGIEKQ